MPSILHRGNGNFSAICSPPLRYRESRTPRKSVLPQHRPAVFYLIRKYQNSPRTGAGIGDAEQKCFCIEDISGKILHLLTLQRLPPSWLPVPWIADFYAFIIGGVFTVKLYIYSSFCVIYTVLAGLHTSFPLPYTLCISFKDRYFVLLFLTSTILLHFHCLFAFWSVFRPSRCGRYDFSRRVSLDVVGIPLGLCMFSVRLHSSHFSFFRT